MPVMNPANSFSLFSSLAIMLLQVATPKNPLVNPIKNELIRLVAGEFQNEDVSLKSITKLDIISKDLKQVAITRNLRE
jgi:hypothetical protein